MTYRVAVAVSGRGSNLLALGETLTDEPSASISLVLSDRNAPALASAKSKGWPSRQLNDYEDGGEWLNELERAKIDLLVLAGYLRLVPPEVIASFRGRIINIHPSLLPSHGGPGMYGSRVHEAVLKAGDQESGATVHLVDEVYDRGERLAQGRVPVLSSDTAATLATRVLELEHRLLPAAVLEAARAGGPCKFNFSPEHRLDAGDEA